MPTVHAAGGAQPERVLGGRYRLVGFIAGGGMAEVWEAYDSLLARPVAVKLPLAHLSRQESFMRRFQREAVAAARLSHPNVVAVYDTGTDDGDSYIVMELVDGLSVRDQLRESGPLPAQRAADIAAQVASALEFAHRAGVVHRDVKPANILLSREGTAKVTDFGIAKALLDADVTETSVTLGTARYISPEQAEGRRPDGRSDVYSLGVVLYEMVCGRSPFDADSDLGIAMHHIRTPPTPPSQVLSSVPPWLERIVLRSLAKDPADRYQSAAEMREALLSGAPGAQPGPGGTRRLGSDPVEIRDPGEKTVPTARSGPMTEGQHRIDERGVLPGTPAARAFIAQAETQRVGAGRRPRREAGGAQGPRGVSNLGRHQPDPATGHDPVVEQQGLDSEVEEPEEDERTRRRLLPLVVGIIVLAAAVTAAVLILKVDHRTAPQSSSPPASPTATAVPIVGEQSFDPVSDGGDGQEDNAGLVNLVSTAPGAYWQTDVYENRSFGNLKPGVGFVLRLDRVRPVGQLSLSTPTPGWNASVYAASAPEPSLQQWGSPVARQSSIDGRASFDLRGTRTGALLVWITELGPQRTVKVNGVSVTA